METAPRRTKGARRTERKVGIIALRMSLGYRRINAKKMQKSQDHSQANS
jgi:hypothetical protein